MKPLKLGLLLLLMALFAGCASTRMARPEPPTLDEIVAMSNAGTPAEEIIKKLKESRAYYPLTAAEITSLHDRGVPDSVLDHMYKVYLREVREDEAQQAYHRGGWYVHPYFYFGSGYRHRWRGGMFYDW